MRNVKIDHKWESSELSSGMNVWKPDDRYSGSAWERCFISGLEGTDHFAIIRHDNVALTPFWARLKIAYYLRKNNFAKEE
ncbi:hypothetical protein [Pseudomonas phage vB_PaeM_H24-1]